MGYYLVTAEYLINKGYGFVERAEPDHVANFKAKTEKEAIKYFKENYGPIVNIDSRDFYKKNKGKLNTYELKKVIATAIAND